MSAKSWFWAVGLLILAGCSFPIRQQVDELICERGSLSFDLQSAQDAQAEKDDKIAPAKSPDPKKPTTLESRLAVPREIPGADAPGIFLPDKKNYQEAIGPVIQEHFPPLAKLQADPDFPPGPDGLPLTLSDLQKIAFTNSPLLRQAASDIQAARGAAIQAGVYPNPTLGYQSSSVGPSGGPNFGIFVGQTIKTMGKLKLAQAAALMDLQNAELAYRRAETDLMASVRTSYYAVLVAQSSIRANRGLVELTDEVYRVMVDQLRGGELAVYEPAQLKVFSELARVQLVQSRNSRLLAWRQLASALGTPHMPPTAVAGSIHRAVPGLDFEKALAHVLTQHTDVRTTEGAIEKARYNLRLAQVTAYPDVNVQAGILNDVGLAGPARVLSTVQVSVPVPVFDRNLGGIRQAQAALVRANEEPHRVQADLNARFSEAYRRYEENRVLLEMYRKNILPKQVQAFRASVQRHFGGEVGAVAFNDLVSSEQNLVTAVGSYVVIVQAQWQAVVDVSSFLQTNQLYQMTDEVNEAPAVDFEEILKLPCCHPCSPPLPAPTGLVTAPAAGPLSEPAAPVAPKTGATFLPPAAEPASFRPRQAYLQADDPLDAR